MFEENNCFGSFLQKLIKLQGINIWRTNNWITGITGKKIDYRKFQRGLTNWKGVALLYIIAIVFKYFYALMWYNMYIQ